LGRFVEGLAGSQAGNTTLARTKSPCAYETAGTLELKIAGELLTQRYCPDQIKPRPIAENPSIENPIAEYRAGSIQFGQL
jgi:energy-converting hydrogenase Eha subunit F